jgi:hypothetical protein
MDRLRPHVPDELGEHLRARCQRADYAQGLAEFAIRQNDGILLDRLEWSPASQALPLLYRTAVSEGADTCLAFFHARGVPVDDLVSNGYGSNWEAQAASSAVRVAANRGHVDTVTRLIDAGARPSPRNAPAVIDAICGLHRPTAMVSLLQSSGWNAWEPFPTTTQFFPTHDAVTKVPLSSGFAPCAMSIRRADADLLRTLLSTKPTGLEIPDEVIRQSVQALISSGGPYATGKPSRVSMLQTVGELVPTPCLAPGVDAEGRVLAERFVYQPDDHSMQDALLVRSLLGTVADGRGQAACATLTEHTRTDLRLRGLAGLSWASSGSGTQVLAALSDADREQALSVLTARFLRRASLGDQPSAKALAQLTASCGKRRWSTAVI